MSFLAFSTTDLGFHIQPIRIDRFYPWDGPFPASSSSQSSAAHKRRQMMFLFHSHGFKTELFFPLYAPDLIRFLLTAQCGFQDAYFLEMWLCLARESLVLYSCITSYPRNSASSGKKKKRTQSSEFLFLFRKVDENAPNVSQIIAFLVSWSVNIAYSRSSFSDAHKLVRDEVFIKSYIPPDTQYSSTPTKSNPLTRRKSTRMVLRSAPSRITIGEQLQVSHSASRNI